MFLTLFLYGIVHGVAALCDSDLIVKIEELWVSQPPPSDILDKLIGNLTYLYMDPGEMKLQGLTCLQTTVSSGGAAKDSLYYVNARESLSYSYRMEQEKPGVLALRGLGDSHTYYNYVLYFKDNVLGMCCCRVCDAAGRPCVEPYVTVAVLDIEGVRGLPETQAAVEEAKAVFAKVGKTVPQDQPIRSDRCFDVNGECDEELIRRIKNDIWANSYPADILTGLRGRLTLLQLANIDLQGVRCVQMELFDDSGRVFIYYDDDTSPLSYKFFLYSPKADPEAWAEVRDINVVHLEHGVAALYQCFRCAKGEFCDQGYATVAVLDYHTTKDRPETQRAIHNAKEKLKTLKMDLATEIRTDCE